MFDVSFGAAAETATKHYKVSIAEEKEDEKNKTKQNVINNLNKCWGVSSFIPHFSLSVRCTLACSLTQSFLVYIYY